MSLLDLANRTLTTPALMDFTLRFRDQIPAEVGLYVQEMYDRNLVRNARLAEQLKESVTALNDRGITPVLFKGAAMLATSPRSHWDSKLMSDLDIMVSPSEVDTALDILFAIGYTVHLQTNRDDEKWYADLKRPRDVGMIDLHRSPPGSAFFYDSAGGVYQHSELISVGKGQAYVPSATYQALMLIIHDQFQDSDYWTGDIDMRHLLDLKDLAQSSKGIDWTTLTSLACGKLARNAIESQLMVLASLLEVDVPARIRTRIIARLQYRRRLLQARFPVLRYILLPIGILDYRNYRAGPGATKAPERAATRLNRFFPKSTTIRFMIDLSRQRRVGKV